MFLCLLPNFACKEAQTCAVEKRYNLESVRSFGGSSSELMLVGAGMRMKFFLNIYAIGLYVTKNKHKVIQSSWAKLGAVDLSTNSGMDEYPMGLLLKFQRGVGADKVVDALVDALALVESGPSSEKEYSTKLGQFKNALLDKIGTSGTQTGDEIEFVFPRSNAEVGVRLVKAGSDGKNSKFDFVKSKTLRDKLLDVYLSKEKAVAPALLKSIESVYSKK